jgi:hypothetical protein
MSGDDDFLDRLRADGFDLDISEAAERVIDVAATIRKLKRLSTLGSVRLPSGMLAQRRKLREMCETRGIEPVYLTETDG